MWVMYDDVTVSLIPASANAVLGYVDGSFATKAEVERVFPHAQKVFLTVNGGADADGIDSEPGDASVDTVVRWVKNKLAANQNSRPIVYSAVSGMQELVNALANAGVPRAQIRIMTAHVTEVAHLCGPQCGFGLTETADATQWTFTALGRSLDESLCATDFFSLVPPPKPDPHHYDRFTDKVRRGHVELYDKLRPHPIKNRDQLKVLRTELKRGADQIALGVINEGKLKGKPRDWSHNHAGWRYQNMIERANGKRVVK